MCPSPMLSGDVLSGQRVESIVQSERFLLITGITSQREVMSYTENKTTFRSAPIANTFHTPQRVQTMTSV